MIPSFPLKKEELELKKFYLFKSSFYKDIYVSINKSCLKEGGGGRGEVKYACWQLHYLNRWHELALNRKCKKVLLLKI